MAGHRAAHAEGGGMVLRTARPRQGILAYFRACGAVPSGHIHGRGSPAVHQTLAVRKARGRVRGKGAPGQLTRGCAEHA